MTDRPITDVSLGDTFARYFVECRHLVDLLWPIAPTLRALDPALGALVARHCEDSLHVLQEYEVGAATPQELRQVVTTFNYLVDQLESSVGAMFDVLFEYADSLLSAASAFNSEFAVVIRRQVLVVRASLAKPAPSMEDIQGYYLRLEALITPLEQIVAALQPPVADSEQTAHEPALLVASEVAHG